MKILHSLPPHIDFWRLDRLDDEIVDHDAAFGSQSVPREAARFLEEDADEMHPMDDDDEPLSEPMPEDKENAPAPPFPPRLR